MEIVRNITRHKLRSILTISGIVIGVLALTVMGAFAENFNALIDGGVKFYGSSIQVGPPDGQSATILPISKVEEIKKIDGVEAAFPRYQFLAKPGQVTVVSFGLPDIISAGDPAENNWSAIKTTLASGKQLDPNSTGTVVLGSTIAKEFGKQVGQSIELPVRPTDARPDFVNHSFTVAGILNPTLTAPDTFAYITIPDGQMLLRDSLPANLRGVIDVSQIAQGISVYAKPGTSISDLDKIADRINNQVTGVKATRPSVLVDGFKSGGLVFTLIATVAAVIALFIGGLSVVNTMFMAVSERVREIGLKKAVGATTSHVMREFLIEATLIGVVGGVIGWGLGALATIAGNASLPPGQSSLFLLDLKITLIALGFATGLGALAGILPAFRAATMDPVTALRNE